MSHFHKLTVIFLVNLFTVLTEFYFKFWMKKCFKANVFKVKDQGNKNIKLGYWLYAYNP